ncbi:hypothetical protein KAW50_00130 [candidate division WOR-3 bacterium]|nr:hypothetical protein [candidate division WOR-3 bacterium]
MGTEKETFQVLELRAREIVERMRLLKEENTKIKMQNSELLSRQEKIREKTRKLLDRLSN